jgi:hypothetical protein
MLYGSEWWAVDKRIKQRMNVEEIRMLRWMSEVIKEDRITNENVRGSTGIASVVENMIKKSLRWFAHLMRREETRAIRLIMKINVNGKRGRGR